VHVKSLLTASSIVCQSIQYEAALQLSDPRFKKNSRPLDDLTSGLMSVRPMQFEWKQSGRPAVGFMADEVQRALPSCVLEDANGVRMIDQSALVTVLTQVRLSACFSLAPRVQSRVALSCLLARRLSADPCRARPQLRPAWCVMRRPSCARHATRPLPLVACFPTSRRCSRPTTKWQSSPPWSSGGNA
jgi:hypothetical protein